MANIEANDRLFLDTSYVIARFNERDEHHRAALSLGSVIATCRELWTTDAVLLEVAASFSRPEHRPIAIGMWDQFHGNDPRFRVVEADRERLSEAMDLYRHRTDKAWSLADCMSFAVMNRERLTQALSADGHFVQAGYTALLLGDSVRMRALAEAVDCLAIRLFSAFFAHFCLKTSQLRRL